MHAVRRQGEGVEAFGPGATRRSEAPARPIRALSSRAKATNDRAHLLPDGDWRQVTAATGDLCLSCGLCCTGSLFWAVPVEPDEKVPMPLDAEGRLRLPCSCFNGACSVYTDRPAAGRAFDCRVLQTVQAGLRDEAWAQREIAGMRRVVAALDAALPGREPSLYRRAADYLARHQKDLRDPAFQRKNRDVLRLLSVYEAALTRFHVPGEQKGK